MDLNNGYGHPLAQWAVGLLGQASTIAIYRDAMLTDLDNIDEAQVDALNNIKAKRWPRLIRKESNLSLLPLET